MKKVFTYIAAGSLFFGAASCKKSFIDLNPTSQFTDAVYFKQPADFKAYATGIYGQLPGWDFGTMDNNSDLSANSNGNGYDIGHGTITTSTSANWDYAGIRSCNILLSKAEAYTGGDINQYVGEAYFFRAFAYFNLLKAYGGVPLITKVLDEKSPELFAPRNSRYQVMNQILADLNQAIPKLPSEQTIPNTDKGRISKWAAEAFKTQV